MTRAVSISAQQIRPAACRETDIAALRAIAQATVNVELFTVPLYMSALYSIQGMHQITGKGQDFYRCRWWPGLATTANPKTDNERAFNIIFSVFVEEMLHIQMTANIASALGVTPTFTSSELQNPDHSWICYGPNKSIIPHIVDLKHTVKYCDVDIAVNIAELSASQVKLFCAIEEPKPNNGSRDNIKEGFREDNGTYFPTVPFEDWPSKGLPMFGSIDWMYQCYYDYMNLRYDDNEDKKLWEYVFKSGSRQNDIFNDVGIRESHPEMEYPGFGTTLTALDAAGALKQAVDMMNAITDQGEGSTLKERIEGGDANLAEVKSEHRACCEALQVDYPLYDDCGRLTESADAQARSTNDELDHYDRFTELGTFVGKVQTWRMWHEARHEKPGPGPWQAADLEVSGCEPAHSAYGLPSTEVVAGAMNRILAENRIDGVYYKIVSKATVGSIAGITTVLNNYWDPDPRYDDVLFPYPSMVGSGDRMAICWALFGTAPNLSPDVGKTHSDNSDKLYHACQGLDLANVPNSVNECAAVEIFHSCRGSNGCKAQGGCGFVQKTSGGGVCGFALVAAKTTDSETGDGDLFSAPSDNKCATFGGCAVPISASQILPQGGTMQLFGFNDKNEPVLIKEPYGEISFRKGDKVYDVAYKAYRMVMENYYKKSPPQQPEPNDLRLAFPPST